MLERAARERERESYYSSYISLAGGFVLHCGAMAVSVSMKLTVIVITDK